jgi:hypothetical protein
MSTPETDSLLEGEGTQCSVNIVKLLDLCRKLERERNDARDTKWAREIHSCHNACARPICTLRRERDEARKDVDSLLWVLAAIQDAIGCGCGGDYGLCEDCSEAYNKTDALIKARETNQPKP